MSISANWYVFTIAKGPSNTTVGDSLPSVTISTDSSPLNPAGSGPTLEIGEKFTVGTTTFVYDGIATATDVTTGDVVTGFRAHSIKNSNGTGKQSKVFFTQDDFDQDRRIDYITTNDPETDKPVYTDGTVICFYPRTLIRTPAGEVAVETLKIGDLVTTADGAARPVRWMGRQTVSTLFADPLRVLPIRIQAGALAEGLPVRDLLVSPDHAILVGGVLVQAGALVNGSSIRRERDVPAIFTYYHVELASHALILAEGVPAETFVDNIDRLAFDNWAEHAALPGADTPIAEMDLPRAKAQRQVPQAIRARLAARAAALASIAAVA